MSDPYLNSGRRKYWNCLSLRSQRTPQDTSGHSEKQHQLRINILALKSRSQSKINKKTCNYQICFLYWAYLHICTYMMLYTQYKKTVYQHIILCQECTNKKKECVMFKRNECRTESPNPNTKNARHSFSVHHKLRITNQMPPRDSPQWQG